MGDELSLRFSDLNDSDLIRDLSKLSYQYIIK